MLIELEFQTFQLLLICSALVGGFLSFLIYFSCLLHKQSDLQLLVFSIFFSFPTTSLQYRGIGSKRYFTVIQYTVSEIQIRSIKCTNVTVGYSKNSFTRPSSNCECALSCKKRGFVSLRHNHIRNITSILLKEVCKDVRVEPQLNNY